MKLKRSSLITLLALALSLSFSSISIAQEAGNSLISKPTLQVATSTHAEPGASHDKKVDTMDSGHNADATTNSHHSEPQAMDPNMPGMESYDSHTTGHETEEPSEGVNWAVVGGFILVNALIIITAGVMKFKRSTNPHPSI